MNEEIKDELRCRKAFEKDLEVIKEEIEVLWHKYTGLKAVRYDKIPGVANPSAVEEMKLTFSQKIADAEEEKKRIQSQIDHLDSLLNRIENEEIREAIRKVYCEKTPMRIVASEMNISKSGLGKAMDKELYKIQKRGRIHAKCVLKY